MTREQTWDRLVKLGVVKGKMPLGQWNLYRADLSEIDLGGVDLSKTNLRKANLCGTNLNGANLLETDFRGADLFAANLSDADLFRANLSNADLNVANFRNANLYGSNLRKASIREATLSGACLNYSDLSGANLMRSHLNGTYIIRADLRRGDLFEASLRGADLKETNLRGADLSGADLSGANLRQTDLSGAELKGTNLSGADLSEANLMGSDISNANLINCSLLNADIVDANLCKCKIYGVSVWDIKTSKGTKMKDLVISKDYQPVMTIDDIEVAQFIYMLLNNKKISNIINTLRTKAVLILGSFDSKTMIVLETLKDVIRNHGFLPLLFTFEAPHSQELMETVKTMALLSNFVIVDLSTPAGQLHELAKLVSDTFIPFVTIAREGTRATSIHGEFRQYYWFKHDCFSYSLKEAINQIPLLFNKEIVPWAEKINKKISEKRLSTINH